MTLFERKKKTTAKPEPAGEAISTPPEPVVAPEPESAPESPAVVPGPTPEEPKEPMRW